MVPGGVDSFTQSPPEDREPLTDESEAQLPFEVNVRMF
jgi:hypothetical protein